jgi:hypothetical protein
MAVRIYKAWQQRFALEVHQLSVRASEGDYLLTIAHVQDASILNGERFYHPAISIHGDHGATKKYQVWGRNRGQAWYR